ncbi:L-histidine N(alpha)-methyltransferase [archaeon]|nr:L-histidine N(alpha)-methyltransferase [archaeon]
MDEKNDPQRINDLIFRELIKRGYSLEGNTRIWNIADSKLWYLTPDQSQAFLDLEKDKDYKKDIIQKEIKLINEHVDRVLERCGDKPFNLMDLGCGDGKKAVIFLNKIRELAKEKNAKNTKVRYCPIDISSYMVEKALEKIKEAKVEEVVQFQWNISDFENIENIASLLRYGMYADNLILLLGNTLGNFEINELLYEIRSAMQSDDVLVIGNGLDNRHSDEILKAYDNNNLDNLLIRTIMQLGIPREKVKYGTRFKNSRVEMYYILKEDHEIDFLGRKVKLMKGDQIVVAVSINTPKKTSQPF